MVLAVLQQHCGIRLHNQDVFVSTVGGARINEPASDLAIAVSLAGAHFGVPAPLGVVAMGEIGLAGELRRVRDLPQRLSEAARLGFKVAVVPSERGKPVGPRSPESWTIDGMRVLDVGDVASALGLLRLTRSRAGPLRPLD